FAEFCREQGCLDRPYPFPSDHARFLYFQTGDRSPDVAPHEDPGSEVVLMSGLPGSGKDHWIRTHLSNWPLLSLDNLREQLDVAPTDEQRTALNRVRRQARGSSH